LVAADPLLSDLDKAFVREVVYGCMRWRGRLDWTISSYSRIKPLRMERLVLGILRIGAYQLLFMDRIPARAAVDESVKLAKVRGRKDIAPFINGILRGIAEGRKAVAYPDQRAEPVDHIAAYYSHPLWMVRRWLDQRGVDETIALCKADNQMPPLTVRVNTLKGGRVEVIDRLHEEGIEAAPTPFSPLGVVLKDPPSLTSWGLFQEGWLQVQDEASQLASFIVAPEPGERVLDVCAAPGGKTTHLAQLMGDHGEIVAVDISPVKLMLLQANCRRLGISIVEALAHDAQSPLPFSDGYFDRVLVDAPCTGLGTLRRHPDGKWRVVEADIPRLQKLQYQILAQAAPLVKEGGVLVYSTCTMTPEENEGVIEPFLAARKGFNLEGGLLYLPPGCEGLIDEKGYFRTIPHRHGMDGFFAARMQKR
jgi:16S rRNA (cytosine967-C5)-methyltransferase